MAHLDLTPRPALAALFAVAIGLVPFPGAALDSAATYGQPNPGARSMGLGGAFVAQADDATAAFANPAGLVQLLDPEISAEFRLWFDTESSGSDGSSVVDVSAVGFISGVYPLGKWSLALYRNQLAKYEVADSGDDSDLDPWSMASFEIETYGLSAGYRISEALSLGLGVAYNKGDIAAALAGESKRAGTNNWTFNAGVLWHPISQLGLGGFYRQGPDLEFNPVVAGSGSKSIVSPFAVPDVFGLGVSYRSAGGGLILSGEWDRVRYSGVDGSLSPGLALDLDDADELHLGAEYAFLVNHPIIAVRVGTWREPAHRWLVENGERRAEDDDEMHYSAGMGFAWDRFKLDFAADYAASVVVTSVSGIFSF